MMHVPYRTPTNNTHPRKKLVLHDLYTSERDNRIRGIVDRFPAAAAAKHVSLPQNARTPFGPSPSSLFIGKDGAFAGVKSVWV